MPHQSLINYDAEIENFNRANTVTLPNTYGGPADPLYSAAKNGISKRGTRGSPVH